MSRNLEEEDETTGYITYGLNASSSSSFVHLVHSNSPKNKSRPTTVVVETGTGVEEAHMKQVDNDGVVLQILYKGHEEESEEYSVTTDFEGEDDDDMCGRITLYMDDNYLKKRI